MRKILTTIGATGFMILIGTHVFYIANFPDDLSTDQAIWGAFGDFVGGTLNPVLTFLSLLAILFSLALQAEALDHSTRAIETQQEQNQLSSFESSFFALLGMYNEIVGDLDIHTREEDDQRKLKSQGRDCFREWKGMLYKLFERAETKFVDQHKATYAGYRAFYKKWRYDLGHYFRNLYNILRFIDESEFLSFEQKCKYVRILRAQLSAFELVLIFYNSQSDWGIKIQYYIGRFRLLDNLDAELLWNDKDRDLLEKFNSADEKK